MTDHYRRLYALSKPPGGDYAALHLEDACTTHEGPVSMPPQCKLLTHSMACHPPRLDKKKKISPAGPKWADDKNVEFCQSVRAFPPEPGAPFAGPEHPKKQGYLHCTLPPDLPNASNRHLNVYRRIGCALLPKINSSLSTSQPPMSIWVPLGGWIPPLQSFSPLHSFSNLPRTVRVPVQRPHSTPP